MESDDRMDGSPVLIGLLIFLVCCSAFFSASETALTSLSRIRLRNMVEENVKNADLIMRLLEDPNRLLSSILVGNNLVNNGASALTTTLAIQIFRGNSGGAGIPLQPAHPTGFPSLWFLYPLRIRKIQYPAISASITILAIINLHLFFLLHWKPDTGFCIRLPP